MATSSGRHATRRRTAEERTAEARPVGRAAARLAFLTTILVVCLVAASLAFSGLAGAHGTTAALPTGSGASPVALLLLMGAFVLMCVITGVLWRLAAGDLTAGDLAARDLTKGQPCKDAAARRAWRARLRT